MRQGITDTPDSTKIPETTVAEKSQASLVSDQFSPQAAAYVTSAVHADGEDLQALAQIVAGHGKARALDLGCGGGHVSFRVAPHVGQVTAYDLSDSMLGAVAKAADERGLKNIVTRQGPVERLPFEDRALCRAYLAQRGRISDKTRRLT